MNELNSTERFTDRVDAYVAARPSYPDPIAPLLAREYGLKAQAVVADIGCGTGLSCVPFLRAGFAVIGVEPNDAMRAAGEKFLAGKGDFRAVAGTAESTTLPVASVDLVVAAQAAHWFKLQPARAEARRILRYPTIAALIWNDRDATSTPFARDYEQLLQDFGVDYERIRHRHSAEEVVGGFFGHERYRESTLPNPTSLDWPTLVARVLSASYMPQPDSAAYAPMEKKLRELFDAAQAGGKVTMNYVTRVFHGEIAE
jgi:SAM-dependent methyltransferase